jgi:hypothetical protein
MVPAWFSTSRSDRESVRGRAVAAVLLVALAAAVTACSSSSSSGTAAAVRTVGASASGASASGAAASAARIGTDPLTGAAATALLAKAVADTKAAPSVVVKADDLPDGTAGQMISFDLTLVQKVGCKGTIAQSKTSSFQLVVRDGFDWMKPSQGFYASLKFTQAELALVVGRWLKVKSTDSRAPSFGDLCNFSSLIGSMGTPTGTSYVATPTTYDGHSVYEFIASGQPGYAYITNSATPTLVELNIPGKADGVMTFAASSTPLPITAPSAAESLDGSQFGF